MSTSSIPIIRPLSLGQLLDQAIRLYRRNFARFVGIVAIVQVPATLIQIILSTFTTSNLRDYLGQPFPIGQTQDFSLRYFSGLGATLLIFMVSLVLVQVIGAAALTRAIADNRLGMNTGILEAYSKIGTTWLRLFGVILLLALLSVGVAIWLLVPCLGWATGPGMLIYIGLIIFPFVVPVVVLEAKGGGQAIRRAWDLVRRRFWWVMGFVFILYLFARLVISGPTTLLQVVLMTVLGSATDLATKTMLNSVILSLVSLVLSLLYMPLQLTAITLVYFDLRVRTEGFDLAVQAGETAGQSADLTSMLSQAPPAEADSLVSARDVAYFALLTVGGVMIYVVLMLLIFGLGLLFMQGAG